MIFNKAQTFFFDPSAVKGAGEANITRIDLYFRGKPNETNNKSGILSPGVEVTLAQTINGVPVIDEVATIRPQEPTEHGARFAPRFEVARREYGEIAASPTADIATPFYFKNPVQLRTGLEYAIMIKFDGNEDFVLWYTKVGDNLVGTTTQSTGPSGKYAGSLYDFISDSSFSINPSATAGASSNSSALASTATSASPSVTTPSMDYLLRNWKPINNTDLKFKVYCARFAHNGFPVVSNSSITDGDPKAHIPKRWPANAVSNGVLQITSPCLNYEFVKYDRRYSNTGLVTSGEAIYQVQPFYSGGQATPLTVSCTLAGSLITANASFLLANGSTFGAANGFNAFLNTGNNSTIVITNGSNVAVRTVTAIVSNTVIRVSDPLPFTNATAYIYRAPTAALAKLETVKTTGALETLATLAQSTATPSCRFTNNTILSANVTANGSGYSNSDYLVVTGFENVTNEVYGGYQMTANIRTNASGNVVSLYITNAGAGFVNTSWLTGANVLVKNANNVNASGTGLTTTFGVGSLLRAEFRGTDTYFANCQIMNINAMRVKPEITVNNPLGTVFTAKLRTLYAAANSSNTFSGKKYSVLTDPSVTDVTVKIFKSSGFSVNTAPVIPSRSNQFIIRYPNGTAANSSIWGEEYSNSACFLFEVSSNNDYTSAFFEPDIIMSHYSSYVINNDYTNEHTNYGNAYAKHVTTKVNFANDRKAEDLLVYLTAYRPAGTDVVVYARIHNSADTDAFDDADWTLMEKIDGDNVFSSVDDTSDFKEITYGFKAYPNSAYIITGSGEFVNATTFELKGSGTNFTANVAVGDLLKISQKLFPNSYFISVVNSVTNTTSLTLKTAPSNNGLIGAGLKIEKIGYPHQAYNNMLTDNVVRYHNSTMVEYDTYDTAQLKIIFLSNTAYIVPKVDDIRFIGVTS